MLVIVDGLGYRKDEYYNGWNLSDTPCLQFLIERYGMQLLSASGTAVGLPEGVVGNSEAGHVTIGAGSVILQDITRIDHAIDDGSLQSDATVKKLSEYAVAHTKTFHIIGICSDGYVHGHSAHIIALMRIIAPYGAQIYIHAILDGRDVPARSATTYLHAVQEACDTLPNARIGSIQGRFYAMDRAGNWDRTNASFSMLTAGDVQYASWGEALEQYYERAMSDEYVPPTLLMSQARIADGDVCFFTNARPERMEQLVRMCAGDEAVPYTYKPVANLMLGSYIAYDLYVPNVLFKRVALAYTLKEHLSERDLHIFTIAESEKFAQVNYFFNGFRQAPFTHETVVLVPSLAIRSYAQAPEMSAPSITQQVLNAIAKQQYDFILVNFANPDMVGHTGDFAAARAAMHCVDQQIEKLYKAWVVERNNILCIVGDHGKIELMYDEQHNQPYTAHTANPVPFITTAPNGTRNHMTSLADVADYVLEAYKK